MARPRFEKLDPQKQEAILAAAADEFAARGFEGASLNRIIERAGTSKGALYYYFDDKADLLATVAEQAVKRVLAETDFPPLASLTKEDYWERVRDVSRRSFRSLEVDTWYVRLLRAFWRLREEEGARSATAGVMDWSRDLTREFLERGQTLGTVRTDLPLELMLEMFLAADEAGDRWILERWEGLDERGKAGLLDARLDFARDMLDARHMGWEP
ncbi:MAG TPA: TetR/AcrR family transcriptional regulator [Longimicrobiales bacterium]|nr:TetR/AcrR family transcriptional regulator [Longimicrobiales bacterium]